MVHNDELDKYDFEFRILCIFRFFCLYDVNGGLRGDAPHPIINNSIQWFKIKSSIWLAKNTNEVQFSSIFELDIK